MRPGMVHFKTTDTTLLSFCALHRKRDSQKEVRIRTLTLSTKCKASTTTAKAEAFIARKSSITQMDAQN